MSTVRPRVPTPQIEAKLDQRYVAAERRRACRNCRYCLPVVATREYARWEETSKQPETFVAPAAKSHLCTFTLGKWFRISNVMSWCAEWARAPEEPTS